MKFLTYDESRFRYIGGTIRNCWSMGGLPYLEDQYSPKDDLASRPAYPNVLASTYPSASENIWERCLQDQPVTGPEKFDSSAIVAAWVEGLFEYGAIDYSMMTLGVAEQVEFVLLCIVLLSDGDLRDPLFVIAEASGETPTTFQQEYQAVDSLNADQISLLHLWWCAVHLVVDVADWYSWKGMSDPVSREMLLRRPMRWNEPGFDYDPSIGFAHTTPMFISKKQSDSFLSRFCQPSAAAWFSKHVVCGNQFLADPMQAVDRLVEWFHGPSLAYATCDALAWMKLNTHSWCKPFSSQQGGACDLSQIAMIPGQPQSFINSCAGQPPPTYFVPDAKLDGRQAWIHNWSPNDVGGDDCTPYYLGTDGSYRLEEWYWDAKLTSFSPPAGLDCIPGSFVRRALVKQGGCGSVGSMLVVACSGMNIPALLGKRSGNHKSVLLPVLGLGLVHGDDLWNPGGALFPARDLWLPEEIALGPIYLRRFVAESLIQTTGEKPNFSNLGSTAEDQIELAANIRAYCRQRQYFLSMLENAQTDPRYAQTALDAALFIASQLGAAFTAIREWMSRKNPIHPASEEKISLPADFHLLKEAPGAYWPGWDSLVSSCMNNMGWSTDPYEWPLRVRDEPRIQSKVAELHVWFGLLGSYNIHPDFQAVLDKLLGTVP